MTNELTHDWVAMTFVPVERLADELGDPVFVDTMNPEREPQTVYGCNRCFAPAVSPQAHEECIAP